MRVHCCHLASPDSLSVVKKKDTVKAGKDCMLRNDIHSTRREFKTSMAQNRRQKPMNLQSYEGLK